MMKKKEYKFTKPRQSVFGRGGRPQSVTQNVLPQGTLFVPQAYGAIIARTSPLCTGLGTTGMISCLGVVLYTTSHVFVGHFDSSITNVGFDCADAAIDRLRELNDRMDVWCVLVNWGSSTVLCGEMERVMQQRVVDCQKPGLARICADFYVAFHMPDTVIPCSDPGNVHNQGNFSTVKDASGGHIYRLRNYDSTLHFQATEYHDHNWN